MIFYQAIRLSSCLVVLVSLILVLSGCRQASTVQLEIESFNQLETPCQEGGSPNLYIADSGAVFLTWLEYINDSTEALLFSELGDDKWNSPKEIASGSNWFSNWADFPSMVTYSGSSRKMAAHWLQMRAEGTYDYDIHIAQSQDSGKTWKPSFIPHKDSIAAEHGFVNMLPLPEDRIFAVWLDGRYTKTGVSDHSDGHGHGGPMTLRCGTFDIPGSMADEYELDSKVCDCCQTSAARTSEGIIVAYRDRSDEEVRDISVVRQVGGQWSEPQKVHNDGWQINGCPVNGPVIAGDGDLVAVAWFTAAEEPSVLVAFSNDAGKNFAEPIRIDDGDPLGRVSLVILADGSVLISWLERMDDTAGIQLVKVSTNGKKSDSRLLVETSGSRQSGFPIMKRWGDRIILTWTEVTEEKTVVRSGTLKI